MPLTGQTVLNLRAAEDAAPLSEALLRLGARVVERPVLAFAPPESWAPFDGRLARLKPGEWIAFTSPTALRFTLQRLAQLGRGASALQGARIAALGAGSARALTAAGLPPHVTPTERFEAEGLRDALLAALKPGEEVWLPRAAQGREVLIEDLEAAGHAVRVTPVYRTVPAPEGLGPVLALLQAGGVDWIVFTSSSMVAHFLAGLPPEGRAWLARPRIACLGRITAETARGQGLIVAVTPTRQDLTGLVEALADQATHAAEAYA